MLEKAPSQVSHHGGEPSHHPHQCGKTPVVRYFSVFLSFPVIHHEHTEENDDGHAQFKRSSGRSLPKTTPIKTPATIQGKSLIR